MLERVGSGSKHRQQLPPVPRPVHTSGGRGDNCVMCCAFCFPSRALHAYSIVEYYLYKFDEHCTKDVASNLVTVAKVLSII
jgi:hypothetical protein